MTITIGGLAVLVLLGLFLRGHSGRIGIGVAALCGALVSVVGTLAVSAGHLVASLATAMNGIGH